MTRMLTVEQAAEMLQVKPNTIRTWIKQGRIPGCKIGKVYRIPEDDLQKALSPRQQDPHEKWRSLSQEERDRLLDEVQGMFAGHSRTVDDFMREKYEEVLEEERRWDERQKARESGKEQSAE